MKLATKFAAVLGTASLLSSSALFAGDGKTFKEKVVVEEPTQWWNASLSTGWDSLYMFRGVNVLPDPANGYGSSLYWTQLSVTFNLSENDFLTIGNWIAFGLTDSSYKEDDVIVSYAHTIGNLTLKAGYTFYALLNVPNGLYSHELNVGASYAIELGPVTLTPGLNYYFNVGPNFGNRGFVEQCASYLEARLDASVPLYKDVISLAPYVSFGTSFRYNFTTHTDPATPFVGTNNIQGGVALPIAVTDNITISPYGAYSYQWYGLVGTTPSTWWGGGSVTFSF